MDRYKDKPKEELIIELKELQQELSIIKSDKTNDKSIKKLLENEGHYRYLFESNPQPMWIYDIKSLSFIEINNAAIHHYGYSKEEFLGMTIKDIRPKEDIEALQKDIELTNQPYNLAGEWRHLKKNGEVIFVEIISHAITINNRKARYVMVNDITLQKRAIEDRTEALMLYNALVDQAGDAFFVHDFEGKFIEVNQQACESLGYSKEELLKMSVYDIEMDFDLKSAKNEWAKIKSGVQFTLFGHQKRKDGTVFPAEVRFGCYEWKNQKLFLALVRDITERKKEEEKLNESEYRFRKLYEDGANGMVMVGKDFKFRMANRTFCQMVGYKEEELRQLTFIDITHPDDRDKDIPQVKKMMAGEIDVYRTEKRFLNKDGQTYWAQLTLSPFYDSDGQFLHNLGIIFNITDRKKAEEILKESYALIKIAGEKAKLGGWNVNIGENCIFWSDEVAAIHEMPSGYLPKVEEGINFYAPEWRGKIKKAITNCVRKGISFDEEMQIITAGGKRVWVNTIGEAVRDNKGKTVKVQGAFQDISERKRAEESLRQSEENLSITLNSIGDGVIATDLNGLVVNMNPVAEKMCGWSLIDAAGKPLSEIFNIVNAYTRKAIINPVKKVLQNGEIVGLANHTVLISKNGTEYQISDSAAPIKNKEGKISGVVLVFSDVTEKYLNEQSLIENEERLNLFFNQSITGFFFMETDEPIIWDESVDKEKTLDGVFVNLRVIKVNQAMLDQYMTTEDEFINRTLYDFFAHDINQGRRVIKDLFDNGSLHIDTSERRFDDTQMWIEGDYICLYDSKGNIKGLFGTQQDITERKQAAKALQESEEKFKNIFHNHSAVKLIINPKNGNIVEANLAAADFYGWPIDELQQMNLSQINASPPEQLKKEMENARELKKNQFEFKHRKADGSIIDVEVFSSKIVFDNKDFLHSIIHDISEKKKNEEQIRLFKEAVEQSPASNIITDTQGNIVYVNPKTLKVTGYELSELLGKNPKMFSAGEKPKEAYKVLWENIASGKEWRGEFHNKKKNGALYWELASISPILNKEGKITHYLAVKEDITERKQLLQDLIMAKEHAEQSDKLKSAFLANMSHEIRTPMNSILGFTELLKNPGLSNEKQQKFINVIQKSGDRLLNIINDVVDISKIEAGLMKADIKASNIKEQIEYISAFFKPEVERKGIQFFVKNSSLEDDLIVETDHEKIYAIFTNLIKNAIKFTNEGFIIFGYERKGGYLEFYVKDTGIGIPKDRHEAIFERFIQADISDKLAFQGAGLGLSITKSYIELLGGKIWLESEVENLAEGKKGGSAFYFTIPYITSPITETKPKNDMLSGKSEKLAGNLKILIAEDDEASSIYLSILVEEFSLEILTAKNGLEAVEIYKNNPDIDLILMDMQMPYLNGYEAASQIRQLNKNVVMIAQTAFALSYDRQKVIEAGCNDYISKPILIDDLTALIGKYFN